MHPSEREEGVCLIGYIDCAFSARHARSISKVWRTFASCSEEDPGTRQSILVHMLFTPYFGGLSGSQPQDLGLPNVSLPECQNGKS